jgi:hypothetical protein
MDVIKDMNDSLEGKLCNNIDRQVILNALGKNCSSKSLNSLFYGSNSMDHGFAWCLAEYYKKKGEKVEFYDKVTVYFAIQLEMQGQLENALLMTLRIQSDTFREKFQREMICRNISRLDDSICVHMQFAKPFYQAKIMHCKFQGDTMSAVQLMLNSASESKMQDIHKVIVDELAPKMIFTQTEQLRKMLTPLHVAWKKKPLDLMDWKTRGGVYFEYLNCNRDLEQLETKLRLDQDFLGENVLSVLDELETRYQEMLAKIKLWNSSVQDITPLTFMIQTICANLHKIGVVANWMVLAKNLDYQHDSKGINDVILQSQLNDFERIVHMQESLLQGLE